MNFALSIKYDIRLLRGPFLLEDVAIPYACKERQKAYNKEYRKEYYQKNKEKIKKRTYALKKKKKQEYHRIHHWDEHNGYAETEVVLDKHD